MPEHPTVTAAPAPASAAAITKGASRQSYLTIRWLADRAYRDDAFALYAYFRWLDDTVDERLADREAELAFVARQRDILARAAGGASDDDLWSLGVTPEEALLVGLARAADASTTDPATGLPLSLGSMLDVMEFDARRRGHPVTQDELDGYTHDLAVAVTEALHHCIGHGCGCPRDDSRYVAVTGAHVAHMLRDLAEDVAAGYLNLPAGLVADDLHSPAVRAWVRERVGLARECFATGRQYLARVESARCRLAGHAYIARFEWVLDSIERDGYALRAAYPERATWRGGFAIASDGVRSAVGGRKERRQRATAPGVGDEASRDEAARGPATRVAAAREAAR
jgi:phytoene/squalene synthetase